MARPAVLFLHVLGYLEPSEVVAEVGRPAAGSLGRDGGSRMLPWEGEVASNASLWSSLARFTLRLHSAAEPSGVSSFTTPHRLPSSSPTGVSSPARAPSRSLSGGREANETGVHKTLIRYRHKTGMPIDPCGAQVTWLCKSFNGIFGVWLTVCLLMNFAILSHALRQLGAGAGLACPLLAGMRYQLLLIIFWQGIAGGIQSLRGRVDEDAGSACGCGEVPEHIFFSFYGEPKFMNPAPLWVVDLAAVVEVFLLGYLLLFVFTASPLARSLYRSKSESWRSETCQTMWLVRTLMVVLLLLLPVVVLRCRWFGLLIHSELVVLVALIGAWPVVLSCYRTTRMELGYSWSSQHIQEWIVISSNLLSQVFKLLLVSLFEDGPARFFMGFVSLTTATLALAHMWCISSVPKDPLLLLGIAEFNAERDQRGACCIPARTFTLRKFWRNVFDVRVAVRLMLGSGKLSRPLCWIFLSLSDGVELSEADRAFGQVACELWHKWTSSVPSAWPGLCADARENVSDTGGEFDMTALALEIKNVKRPDERAPEEDALKQSGWRFVFGDIFSDRVHSPVFASIVIIQNIGTNLQLLLNPPGDDSLSVFAALIVSCLTIFVFNSVGMFVNNPFNSPCWRSFWFVIMLVISLCSLPIRIFFFWQAHTHTDLWFALVNIPLNVVYLISLLRARYCNYHIHDHYHTSEFAALRYARVLLRGEKCLEKENNSLLEKGQAGVVRLFGCNNRCLLRAAHSDGTCRLFLENGVEIDSVLTKHIMQLDPFSRIEENCGTFAILQNVAGAFDALVRGVVDRSPRTAVADDTAQEEEPRVSQVMRALPQSVRRLSRVVGQTLSLREAVGLACQAGIRRKSEIAHERVRATSLRSCLTCSISLPVLMLFALFMSGGLLVFAACSLATWTTSFDTLLRNAMVQASMFKGLIHAGLTEGCGLDLAHTLFSTFDSDLSGKMEVNELDYLFVYLSGALSHRFMAGEANSTLLAQDFRALSISGYDLAELDLQRLLCEARGVLEQRDAMSTAMAGIALGTANISAGTLIPLLDTTPSDGALSKSEVLDGIEPFLRSLPPENRRVLMEMIELSFISADNNPFDDRVDGKEMDTLARDLSIFFSGMPGLMLSISAAISGNSTGSDIDGALLLRSLDLDQDGFLSRHEAKRLVLIVETFATIRGLDEFMSAGFEQSDVNPKDDRLDAAELDVMSRRIQQMIHILRFFNGGAEAADTGLLITFFDQNGDSMLNQSEFNGLATFFPTPHGHFITDLVFSRADANPKDAQVDTAEFDEAITQLQVLANNLNQEELTGRRLVNDAAEDVPVEVLLTVGGIATRTLIGSETAQMALVSESVLDVLSRDEFSIILPLVILGLRISIVVGLAFSVRVLVKTKDEYEKQSERITTGDRNFIGSSQWESLRNSFSTSASFPSMLVAQTICNIALGTVGFFMLLLLIASPLVISRFESGRRFLRGVISSLVPVIVVAILRSGLKSLVVDRFLVAHGQPVYPGAFSCCWTLLVFLNFANVLFLAPFRYIYIWGVAVVKTCYIHTTILGETSMRFDAGYYAFLSLTFTQSVQRNLLRRCFISLTMPQSHRRFSPEPPPESSEQTDCVLGTKNSGFKRSACLRFRNKLWLAVTLTRNPELLALRRRSEEKELHSLDSLWMRFQTVTDQERLRTTRVQIEKQVTFEPRSSSSDEEGDLRDIGQALQLGRRMRNNDH
eukprot:TRINITY_DN7538_c0_g1_i18.p1 TRINITY_DN7538_c0_g1~~TRINITY_DN7538_c0_g1_i18.p1  ORF type:complete len:1709 (-),score=174.54 TRINITY_DN7538_c0_g1_i18:395-5521(-)